MGRIVTERDSEKEGERQMMEVFDSEKGIERERKKGQREESDRRRETENGRVRLR